MQRRCDSARIKENPSPAKRNPRLPSSVTEIANIYDSGRLTLTPRHDDLLYIDPHALQRIAVKETGSRTDKVTLATHLNPDLQGPNSTHSILAARTAQGLQIDSLPAVKYDCMLLTDVSVGMNPPPPVGALQRLATPTDDSASSIQSTPEERFSGASICSSAPSSASSMSAGLNAPKLSTLRKVAPQLVKEPARQYSYVDSLVDAATIIVDSLWPSMPKNGKAAPVKLLSYFITETSRKSKTSLSTMQLTLFYCIKYKRNQLLRSEAMKTMTTEAINVGSTCARRNFLSALILASKFLQDRNFSNKAWSKISSVPNSEINTREREFLEMTDWQLEVRHENFKSWSQTMDNIISEIRETTMFGSARACHSKWRQIVRTMSVISEAQMFNVVARLSNSNAFGESQLLTPMASPTEELPAAQFDFAPKSALLVPAAVLVAADARTPTIEEMVLLDRAIAQAQYATPQSMRTASPASSEESYQTLCNESHYVQTTHGLLTPDSTSLVANEAYSSRGLKRQAANHECIDIKRLRV